MKKHRHYYNSYHAIYAKVKGYRGKQPMVVRYCGGCRQHWAKQNGLKWEIIVVTYSVGKSKA